MAKKKLLNEATVRRFMGLAGMDSTLVSNKLNEMGMKYKRDMDEAYMEEDYGMKEVDHMEEGLYEEEEEDVMGAGEEGPDDMDMEAGAEPDAEGELNIDEETVMKAVEAYDELGEVMDMLKGAVGADDMEGEDELDDMDAAPVEEPADDLEADADADAGAGDDEEVLEGVDLQLSEDEIVNEVVRRVTKRIIRAKNAKNALDEALGRKK